MKLNASVMPSSLSPLDMRTGKMYDRLDGSHGNQPCALCIIRFSPSFHPSMPPFIPVALPLVFVQFRCNFLCVTHEIFSENIFLFIREESRTQSNTLKKKMIKVKDYHSSPWKLLHIIYISPPQNLFLYEFAWLLLSISNAIILLFCFCSPMACF
jgi:hypothetical protein